jgi:hypothetical protein
MNYYTGRCQFIRGGSTGWRARRQVERSSPIRVVLRFSVFQPNQLQPDLVAKRSGIRRVHLNKIAARIAKVELNLAAGQLIQVGTHRCGVVKTSITCRLEDSREVVDPQSEMVVRGRGCRPLEEMELTVTDAKPLHRETEVWCVDQLRTEDLGVELN